MSTKASRRDNGTHAIAVLKLTQDAGTVASPVARREMIWGEVSGAEPESHQLGPGGQWLDWSQAVHWVNDQQYLPQNEMRRFPLVTREANVHCTRHAQMGHQLRLQCR